MSDPSSRIPRYRWLSYLVPLIVCLTADLWTKSAVFRALEFPDGLRDGRTSWWIENVFGLQLSLNPGALFGLGSGMAPLFAIVSLIAAVGIVWWLFVAGAAGSRYLTVLLGVITAGICGNLYDRLGLHGIVTWRFPDGEWYCGIAGNIPAGAVSETPLFVVRDWILVMIGSYHWPNFNLADCYLVCGACLLFIASAFTPGILGLEKYHGTDSGESKTGETGAGETGAGETNSGESVPGETGGKDAGGESGGVENGRTGKSGETTETSDET